MLAITSKSAYEICVLKINGIYIDTYNCSETNYEYMIDIEGNKCATSCEDGKVLLIRENMCNDTCDKFFYVLNNNNECGLCKQFYPDKPYKIINSPNCLSSEEIPEQAEDYNPKLYLLKCKEGYKVERDKQKENINECFKGKNIIKENIFKIAIRTFIVLFLNFEKDKKNNIKENHNNLVNYLDIPDLWDKTISGKGDFHKELNDLKELKIRRLIFSFSCFGG